MYMLLMALVLNHSPSADKLLQYMGMMHKATGFVPDVNGPSFGMLATACGEKGAELERVVQEALDAGVVFGKPAVGRR